MEHQRLTRRKLLTGLGATLAAGVAAMARPSGNVQALEHCYWLKVAGPFCNGSGQLIEQWCFRCCGGLMCETMYCEYRVVGSC